LEPKNDANVINVLSCPFVPCRMSRQTPFQRDRAYRIDDEEIGDCAMATINWKTAVSDLFSNAADWSTNTVPGSADDALLGALGGSAYTVTAAGQAVNSLQTAANATLAVAANQNFQMINGTGAGVNAGQVSVGNNSVLYLGGTFNNTSTVAAGGLNLNGVANSSQLRLTSPSTIFTGGGSVVLGVGGNNFVYGVVAANVLDNVNNSFSGVGNIGDGQMALVNETAGVINANQTGVLTLQVSNGVTNTGLLEVTSTGGLFILNTGVDNSANANAGKITATGSGAHVDLQNSTITGGTLTSGAGAQIDVVANQNAYFDGSQPGAPISLTAGTNININNNASLYLYGSISNAGTINLLGAANNSYLRLVTPVTTLTGAGNVVLGSSGNNIIYGLGGSLSELDNVNNTISGAGNVGDGQMTLVNETAGVVNANQTNGLTLQVSGGVTNTGLLEATNTGGLFVLNTGIDNSQGGNAGKITASGTGAHVDLQNSTITGGTLTTTGTGAVIDVVANQVATFDGSVANAPTNIATGTSIQINNNASLYLRGIINNPGTINLGVDAGPNGTYIRLNSPVVTLQGKGKINLSNSANNYIYGYDGATETLNNVDNTIQGSGNIGDGQMTLINGKLGIINANQAPGAAGSGKPGQLIIQAGSVTNNGLIESSVGTGQTAGSDLFFLNTTIDQTGGGKIEAIGTKTVGSTIDLQNTTIRGGTLLSSVGPSLIEVVANQVATLDGTTKSVTVSATLNVLNNSTLALLGAISTSNRSINLNGTVNNTNLTINNAVVTLSGAGKINLSNSVNNRIYSAAGYEQLVNVDNTIQGGGQLGAGTALQLVNETKGVVNANQVSALTLNTTATVQNTGLIESATTVVGAGGLFIVNSNIDNTVANALKVLNTGKITATGTGHIDLQNSNIYGGTLTTTGAAVIDVVSGQAAGLNGTLSGQAVNIAAGSQIVVNNNATLYLYGTINNAGTITDNGGANNTNILFNSSVVTLTGGGHITLAGGTGNDRLYEAQGNAQINNVNNIISGGGQIGVGTATYLSNGAAGVINATLAGGLVINLGGIQLVNVGLLEATGSNLTVANSVFNTGSIAANGGNVAIAGNVNGAGTETISGASLLDIGSSVGGSAAQAVAFSTGSTGTFKIDNAQSFNGTLAGLATGRTLDLGNVAIGTATLSYAGTASNGVLTVSDGNIVSNIKLVGNYTQVNFHLANDGSGHTDVTYSGTGMLATPLPGHNVASFGTAQPYSQVASLIQAMAGFDSSHSTALAGMQIANDTGAMHPMLAVAHG